MQSRSKTGAWYVALSGIFFGFIGYFGMSIIHASISVNTMLFWRFLVASLFMCALLLPQLKTLSVTPKELVKTAFSGLLFYGPSSTLYFMAADRIGSGLAMVLFYTFPAMVMLFNVLFYKHTVSKAYYVALSLILIGMLFLMPENQLQFNLKGIGLSILSAFLFAVYVIFSKNSTAPAQVDTLIVCIGSMVSSFIAATLEHTFVIPTGRDVWINMIGIGIICTSIAILLLLKGLKHIGALQASILSVLEPVFVVLFGVLLLGEVINVPQIVGISILLSGALLVLLS